MDIVIPPRARPQISALLKLPPAVFDKLYSALESSKPHYGMEALAIDLAEQVGIPRPQLESVLELLANWYWLRADSGLDPAAIVDDLEAAAVGDPSTAQGWDERKGKIARLLSLDESLGVSAKATYLALQNFRTFYRARIVTDARPIFPPDSIDRPSAFVVIHTLMISASDSGNKKDWYFTLDDADLRLLRDQVDRALRKREAITSWIDAAGSTTLGA